MICLLYLTHIGVVVEKSPFPIKKEMGGGGDKEDTSEACLFILNNTNFLPIDAMSPITKIKKLQKSGRRIIIILSLTQGNFQNWP